MSQKSKIDPRHASRTALWMFVAGLVVAGVGVILLVVVPFVENHYAGWCILFGLPLAGVGIAWGYCHRRSFSSRR